jgi:DNA-directed RNA polymerase sigma subunit (sigma70/sigma32)
MPWQVPFQRIIRLRFSLDDEDELTLEELGEKHQLTREGIRRRLLIALCKMRKRMRKY